MITHKGAFVARLIDIVRRREYLQDATSEQASKEIVPKRKYTVVHSPSCSTAYPSTIVMKSDQVGGADGQQERTLSDFMTSYNTRYTIECAPSPCDIRPKSNTNALCTPIK